jgi:carboxypeptidase C (cathepsin A)
VVIAGESIDYTAMVGDIVLRDGEGHAKAKFVYVSYLRADVPDRKARPVTFSFNGGPGSASVWVHLGAFGPKKVELDSEGMPVGPPPGRLVNNPYSVLDVTDLVFIDPVQTGFSRPAPGEDPKQFIGFSNDAESVSEFIRLWVSRNGRWASPKFIAGESYGATRSAGLAKVLQDTHGMYLNGICLISSGFSFITKNFSIGNDLPYVLFLPAYTASAWYHGKLSARFDGNLEAALSESEEFALGEFASSLLKGDRLVGEDRLRIVRRLSELTGLDEGYLEDADLRVNIFRFAKELLRDQGKTIGRLDSRYTGHDRDDAGERYEFDPTSSVTNGYFVSLINDYLRDELGYESPLVFRQSAGRLVRPWDFHESSRVRAGDTNRYANHAETLRQAMHKNPSLEVLVMSGYFDLATPYFASDYTVDHMQLDSELRQNIRIAYYEAGHMFYLREADHRKFREDYLQLMRDAGSLR